MKFKKKWVCYLAVFQLALFVSTCAFAGTISELKEQIVGKAPFYFKAMKESMLEIIAENQKLINTDPDGSVKSEKLLPQNMYQEIYRTYLTIVTNFDENELASEKLTTKRTTYLLTSYLQAGRITIANFQDIIDAESDGSVRLKKFIPAVFGRLVAKRVEEKTDLRLKQTTLGKGHLGSRNPYNKPDDWEAKVLRKFWLRSWRGDQGFCQRTRKDEYRFMKPIHVKKACLVCHGGPVGKLGPYGHKKEGYKEGEVRGGISISIPLKN